ncbi:transcriptional regulator [Pantoea vagans]|uniref:Transcriptional regulator n=1 Tax=Pantoea vagans TaxID=470934 RepID=A0ABY3L9G9_9GAMM|nr:transcriptional regulator [Pantoea vagans]
MHYSAMRLLDINKIIPHEDIDPINLDLVSSKILEDGFWFIPVIIDEETGIIMDGHHRYNFAVQSGFSVIPCYQLSYSSEKVKVFDWRSGAPFSNERIFEKVNEGLLFPSKTTRHVFDMVFDTVRVELKTLKE